MDSKSSGSAASNSAPTPTPPAPPPPPPPPAPTFSDDLSSDLSSYRAAVQFDRDLRVFDRTSRAINFLASSSSSPTSPGTLGEVTRNSAPTSTPSVPQTSPHVSSSDLSQFDMEVVRVILECKKGIWDNKDLLSLVNKYFECSIQTRVFFDTLGRCLKRASDLQLILQALPLQFEEENGNLDAGGGDHMLMNGKYETLQELTRDFKETGNPFGDEFFKLLGSVYGLQVQMTEKLNVKHHQLQKKLKGIQVYRKLCGTGFNKLWGKYEDDDDDLKGESDLLQTMRISTFTSLKGLDSIRVLAHRLEMKLDRNLVDLLELAWGPVIEEIKMVGRLREEIKELMLHATIYSQDARKARSIIIHKIITYPSISN